MTLLLDPSVDRFSFRGILKRLSGRRVREAKDDLVEAPNRAGRADLYINSLQYDVSRSVG